MTNLTKLETGFADIEGASLYYEMTGKGPFLVLVHAGLADHRMWDEQFAAFAAHYRVVRYDMRGFGQSPMSPGPFSHRRDLAHLLNFLDIKHAHFIGCSMGGMTVIDFALEQPERVTSMVLVSTAVSGFQFSGSFPQPLLDLLAARQAKDLDKAADLQVQIWVDGFKRASDQADAPLRRQVYQMSHDALVNQVDYLNQSGFVAEEPLDPPAIERLEQLTMSTLIITGALDEDITLATADLLTSQLKNSQKHVILGTTHLPKMERPKEFNRAVLAFLQPEGI